MRAALSLLLVLPSVGLAAPRLYHPVATERPAVTVEIPYSLGTHRHAAARVEGELRIDPDALNVSAGTLRVPIAELRSDNATRDCHLREALGLDYRRSRYPAEHVCASDALPTSGVDAPVHPHIVFTAMRSAPVRDGLFEVFGRWSLHGVDRPGRLLLTVAPDETAPSALRARGNVTFRLSSFDVMVKPAKVLFTTISVADEVRVQLDLTLVPAPQ